MAPRCAPERRASLSFPPPRPRHQENLANRRDFLISSAVTAGWLSGATALPPAAAARNGVLNIAVQPEPPGLMLASCRTAPRR